MQQYIVYFQNYPLVLFVQKFILLQKRDSGSSADQGTEVNYISEITCGATTLDDTVYCLQRWIAIILAMPELPHLIMGSYLLLFLFKLIFTQRHGTSEFSDMDFCAMLCGLLATCCCVTVMELSILVILLRVDDLKQE